MMFFIRHTQAPERGPIAKEAISAGSSDRSNFIKLGINIGTGS